MFKTRVESIYRPTLQVDSYTNVHFEVTAALKTKWILYPDRGEIQQQSGQDAPYP